MENVDQLKYVIAEKIETKRELFSIEKVQEELKAQNAFDKTDNIASLVITHTLDTTQLPLEFDCAFLHNNITNECGETLYQKITFRGCFNYGLKFHTELWQGYNHLALIEFEKEIPMEVFLLATKHEKAVFYLIFCSKEDVDNVKKFRMESKINLDKYWKENHSDIYERIQSEKEYYLKSLK